MLMTSSALNLRSGWEYQFENIFCPLGFDGGRFSYSWQLSLTETRKFVTPLLDAIFFIPAFLNREQDNGAF